MKHKSIVLVCVLLVAVSVYLVQHSNSQAAQSARLKASSVASKAKQDVATNRKLQSQLSATKVQLSGMTAQCEVGVKDYQLLTTAERVHAVLPVCLQVAPSVKQ